MSTFFKSDFNSFENKGRFDTDLEKNKSTKFVTKSKSEKTGGGHNGGSTKHIPCKFYKNGNCTAGDSCTFLHDLSAFSEKPVCKYFAKGSCKYGNKCALLHTSTEISSPNPNQSFNYQDQQKPSPSIFISKNTQNNTKKNPQENNQFQNYVDTKNINSYSNNVKRRDMTSSDANYSRIKNQPDESYSGFYGKIQNSSKHNHISEINQQQNQFFQSNQHRVSNSSYYSDINFSKLSPSLNSSNNQFLYENSPFTSINSKNYSAGLSNSPAPDNFNQLNRQSHFNNEFIPNSANNDFYNLTRPFEAPSTKVSNNPILKPNKNNHFEYTNISAEKRNKTFNMGLNSANNGLQLLDLVNRDAFKSPTLSDKGNYLISPKNNENIINSGFLNERLANNSSSIINSPNLNNIRTFQEPRFNSPAKTFVDSQGNSLGILNTNSNFGLEPNDTFRNRVISNKFQNKTFFDPLRSSDIWKPARQNPGTGGLPNNFESKLSGIYSGYDYDNKNYQDSVCDTLVSSAFNPKSNNFNLVEQNLKVNPTETIFEISKKRGYENSHPGFYGFNNTNREMNLPRRAVETLSAGTYTNEDHYGTSPFQKKSGLSNSYPFYLNDNKGDTPASFNHNINESYKSRPINKEFLYSLQRMLADVLRPDAEEGNSSEGVQIDHGSKDKFNLEKKLLEKINELESLNLGSELSNQNLKSYSEADKRLNAGVYCEGKIETGYSNFNGNSRNFNNIVIPDSSESSGSVFTPNNHNIKDIQNSTQINFSQAKNFSEKNNSILGKFLESTPLPSKEHLPISSKSTTFYNNDDPIFTLDEDKTSSSF
ncbi:Protein cps3 [Smittium culicis]|uniref:Protein cps3 n=1 Tax=Smittium culicis TaxID=133412 RepID=A0A1R1YI00_9FUNG|nr:Protein cps3 [Smittium culicis]